MQRIRKSFLSLAVTASLLLGASIAVTPATAADVTFLFTGTVGIVPAALAPLGTGNMSGTITIDDAATPLVSGVYLFTDPPVIKGLTLNLPMSVSPFKYDSPTLDAGPYGIVITNSSTDSFSAFSSMTGDPINGRQPTSFDWSLKDGTGVAFDNTDLVTSLNKLTATPPGLSLFQNNQWRLIFGPESDGNIVTGSIGTFAVVPLPPAVILFGAGLVALIGLGARNWQRAQA